VTIVEEELGTADQKGARFTVADCQPIHEAARQEAIKDARTRADALARAAAQPLGMLISLSEYGPYAGPPSYGPDPCEVTAPGGYFYPAAPFDAEPLVTVATSISASYKL
jgi:uncharacterized protein YggE